jgi:hypothetical protein
MGEFKDLADYLDPDLRLPWKGKEYRIAAPSAEVGLRCQQYATIAKALAFRVLEAKEAGEGGDAAEALELSDRERQVLSDTDEVVMYRELLGATYDELAADGASWPVIKHMAMTAMTYFTVGEEAAVAAWEGPGKAEPPNRAARRAAAKSTGTAAANETKRRASTSGTRSRTANGQPPAAKPSRGGTSSRAGRT